MLKRERKKVKKKKKHPPGHYCRVSSQTPVNALHFNSLLGPPTSKLWLSVSLLPYARAISLSLSISLSCRPRSNPGRLPNACFLTFFCLIFTCFIYTVLWLQIFWLARNYRTHVSISCLFLSPVFIRSGRVSMVYVYIMNWYCMWAW